MSKIDLNSIPVIPESTKYWIIRSGIESKYFEEFNKDGSIALGWDRITNIEYIKTVKNIKLLKKMVIQKYPELLSIKKNNRSRSSSRKITDITNKVYNFVRELKFDDIIVTPGKDEVLIGKITGDAYLVSNKYKKPFNSRAEEIIGELNKAREVTWLKRIPRKELEPNLRLILGVYHGIAHINNPQVITEINRSIFSYYVKENKAHSVIKVNTQEEIDFEKYAFFIKNMQIIYQLLKEDFNNDKLFIKTNVQSPGPIEIIGNVGLVSQVILGTRAILKYDNLALEAMDENSKKIIEVHKRNYKPEFDYDDYEFPNYGSY